MALISSAPMWGLAVLTVVLGLVAARHLGRGGGALRRVTSALLVVLTAALLSGSAERGAATMLAFGLGTLPNLLLAGMLLQRLRSIVQARYVRLGSGLLVIAFGVWGLLNATSLGGRLWAGIAC